MKNLFKNYLTEVEKKLTKNYPDQIYEFNIQYGIEDICTFYSYTPHKIVKGIIKGIDDILVKVDNLEFAHKIKKIDDITINITISIILLTY